MSDDERDPTETPTTSTADAEQEGKRMVRNWLGIAVVSILTLLLVVIAMMQWTGLVDVFAPIAETEGQQWGAFVVLALVVIVLAGWSWKSIVS